MNGYNHWGCSQEYKHVRKSKGERRRTCPSADHARQLHWGGSALLLGLITSCLSSSTMILPSRSYMLTAVVSNWTLLQVNDRFSVISRLNNPGAQKQPLLSSDNTVSIQSFITATFNAALFWRYSNVRKLKSWGCLPRSWCSDQWQHITSNGWGWSREHWWCHHCPGCKGACLRSGPTAWLDHPAKGSLNHIKDQISYRYSFSFTYLSITLFAQRSVGWPKQDRLNDPQTKQILNVKCHK